VSTLAEAYYRVGNHLRQRAEQMKDAAEMLFEIADRMSELEMQQKQPAPESESDG